MRSVPRHADEAKNLTTKAAKLLAAKRFGGFFAFSAVSKIILLHRLESDTSNLVSMSTFNYVPHIAQASFSIGVSVSPSELTADPDAMDVDVMDQDESYTSIGSSSESEDNGDAPPRRNKKRVTRPNESFGLEDDQEEPRVRANHHDNMAHRFNPDSWEQSFRLEIVVEVVKAKLFESQASGLPRTFLHLEDYLFGLTHFKRFAEASSVLINLVLNGVVTIDGDQIYRAMKLPPLQNMSVFIVANGNATVDTDGVVGWDFKLALMRAYHFFAHSFSGMKDQKVVMENLVELCEMHFAINTRSVLEHMANKGLIECTPIISESAAVTNYDVKYPFLTSYCPRATRPLCHRFCRDNL